MSQPRGAELRAGSREGQQQWGAAGSQVDGRAPATPGSGATSGTWTGKLCAVRPTMGAGHKAEAAEDSATGKGGGCCHQRASKRCLSDSLGQQEGDSHIGWGVCCDNTVCLRDVSVYLCMLLPTLKHGFIAKQC